MEKANSPVFFCLAVDVLVCLLIYVGYVLDSKRMWLLEATDSRNNQSDQEVDGAEEGQAVDKTGQLPEMDRPGGDMALERSEHKRLAQVHPEREQESEDGSNPSRILVNKNDNRPKPAISIELQDLKSTE